MQPDSAIRRQLGEFHDLTALRPVQSPIPSRLGQHLVMHALAGPAIAAQPIDIRLEATWERDGIAGEELTWSVGYGPRTHAWLLRPAGTTSKLSGIIALHDHCGYKYFGKEKIADGPSRETSKLTLSLRDRYYGERAYANELARAGFAVLVPDVFLWGSRKFDARNMRDFSAGMKIEIIRAWRKYGSTETIARYNLNASFHEAAVGSCCQALGMTISGIIHHEDLAAVNYLSSRPDVLGNAVGCIGLSAGGLRAGLLAATCKQIRAAVIVGMMSSGGEALPHDIAAMLNPYGDWPAVVACRQTLLLVQYCKADALFSPTGMRAAHRELNAIYRNAMPARYRGKFYPGRHRFDIEMQDDAFSWLKHRLKP